MTTLVSGTSLRQIDLGIKVDKATAIVPASGNQTIFTVTVGRVVVTSLVGEFTAAGDGTATTLKVTSAPSAGSAVDLTSAVAITSKEIGALVTLPLTLGGALNVQNAGAGEIPGALKFLVPIGVIRITTNATDATASIKWSITYYPYDDGATVA